LLYTIQNWKIPSGTAPYRPESGTTAWKSDNTVWNCDTTTQNWELPAGIATRPPGIGTRPSGIGKYGLELRHDHLELEQYRTSSISWWFPLIPAPACNVNPKEKLFSLRRAAAKPYKSISFEVRSQPEQKNPYFVGLKLIENK
jgi:hypothetical protein